MPSPAWCPKDIETDKRHTCPEIQVSWGRQACSQQQDSGSPEVASSPQAGIPTAWRGSGRICKLGVRVNGSAAGRQSVWVLKA